MTHVVQFTTLSDFIADLTASETAAVYHDLIEQRTAIDQSGITSWLLVTIIRAIVANGRVTHLATLTIPHGREVKRVYGRILGPPGVEDNEPARWSHARDEHTDIIDHLRSELDDTLRTYGVGVRPGILNVPADLPLILAPNPLDELADQRTKTEVNQ